MYVGHGKSIWAISVCDDSLGFPPTEWLSQKAQLSELRLPCLKITLTWGDHHGPCIPAPVLDETAPICEQYLI